MHMKPRCGKLLRTGNLCNRKAGHTSHCQKDDLTKKAATSAAWSASNPERMAALVAAWDAAHPGRKAATTAAWGAAHPGRVAATTAAWHKANPERKRASEGKRRALKKGATTEPFTQDELKARMSELGAACYYCDLLGLVGPHECDDHFFPLQPRKGYRPGAHALWNLYPSCNKHNLQKHNKQPINFINKLLETKC